MRQPLLLRRCSLHFRLAETDENFAEILARSAPNRHYFRRIRSTLSHCDMSDRITLSPTCKPESTSMVVTEMRPSFTLTREASEPSGVILNRLMVLSAWP